MLAVVGYLTTYAGVRFPGAEDIPAGFAAWGALPLNVWVQMRLQDGSRGCIGRHGRSRALQNALRELRSTPERFLEKIPGLPDPLQEEEGLQEDRRNPTHEPRWQQEETRTRQQEACCLREPLRQEVLSCCTRSLT